MSKVYKFIRYVRERKGERERSHLYKYINKVEIIIAWKIALRHQNCWPNTHTFELLYPSLFKLIHAEKDQTDMHFEQFFRATKIRSLYSKREHCSTQNQPDLATFSTQHFGDVINTPYHPAKNGFLLLLKILLTTDVVCFCMSWFIYSSHFGVI